MLSNDASPLFMLSLSKSISHRPMLFLQPFIIKNKQKLYEKGFWKHELNVSTLSVLFTP